MQGEANDVAARAAVRPIGVLVVEDDMLTALVIAAVLADLGCEVTGVAPSAEVAERCAAERRPDLVLVDIGLHGPTDGIEAAHALKERHGVPTLFVTARHDGATKARARAVAPVGYLLKPFLPVHLEAALRSARAAIGLRT